MTSPWSAFRDLSPRAVAGISVAGGIVACLAQLTGFAGVLYGIPLPGFLGPIGAALRTFIPGVTVGVVTLAARLAVRLVRPANA